MFIFEKESLHFLLEKKNTLKSKLVFRLSSFIVYTGDITCLLFSWRWDVGIHEDIFYKMWNSWLSHFKQSHSLHQRIQLVKAIVRSFQWFQCGTGRGEGSGRGGLAGLRFHQVGFLLNDRRSLNVPIKVSEVAILLDIPFLCAHCMNPGAWCPFLFTPLLSLCVSLFKPKPLHYSSRSHVMWYITLPTLCISPACRKGHYGAKRGGFM